MDSVGTPCAGSSFRLADDSQESGLFSCCGCDTCPRHRREHSDLQHHGRRTAPATVIPAARAPCPHMAERAENERATAGNGSAGVYRLSRPDASIFEHRRLPGRKLRLDERWRSRTHPCLLRYSESVFNAGRLPSDRKNLYRGRRISRGLKSRGPQLSILEASLHGRSTCSWKRHSAE